MAKRYSGKNPCSDKEWLHSQFIVEGKSRKQIADEIGCTYNTVNSWLWRHGIAKKKPYDAQTLTKMHVDNKITVTDIAKHFNVSYDTIVYQLRVNKIPYTPYLAREDKLAKYTAEWVKANYVDKATSIAYLSSREGIRRETLSAIIKSHGYSIKHYEDSVPSRLDNLLRMWTHNNIRGRVLKDRSECEVCGSDEKINLHHKVTLKEMVTECIKITGYTTETDEDVEKVYHWMLENTALLKDVDNIAVLCEHCHRVEHARRDNHKPSLLT